MRVSIRYYCSLVFWAALLVTTGNVRAEALRSGQFYELLVPALKGDDGDARDVSTHLVRLDKQEKETILRRMWPSLYFRAYNKERFLERSLTEGLLVEYTDRHSRITLNGVIIGDRLSDYCKVRLTGDMEQPGVWRGAARVQVAPYFRLSDGVLKSEWILFPARTSVIYARMLNLLSSAKSVVDRSVPSTDSDTKYITFLRGTDGIPNPGRSALTLSIDTVFRAKTADALEGGDIVYENGRFRLSEQIRKTLDEDSELPRLDATVRGAEREGYLPSQRAIKHRPLWDGHRIRLLALKPEKERKYGLACAGKKHAEFLRKSGYTWDELAVAPDVALLIRHMADVPEDLRDRIAKGYIRDGSLDYFPGMTFGELADVPKPVLLAACLPHMKEQDAAKLANAARVKNLLQWAGLERNQVGDYSIPGLVAKIVENVPEGDVEGLLDISPGMKPYLRNTKNEVLRQAIQRRALDLSE